MKTVLIQYLLLLAMMFNIAHASIIAEEDHCTHETVSEYVSEMTQSQECNDMCDLHHLFHLTAIITPAVLFFTDVYGTEQPETVLLSYHPPFKETENKPPIA